MRSRSRAIALGGCLLPALLVVAIKELVAANDSLGAAVTSVAALLFGWTFPFAATASTSTVVVVVVVVVGAVVAVGRLVVVGRLAAVGRLVVVAPSSVGATAVVAFVVVVVVVFSRHGLRYQWMLID